MFRQVLRAHRQRLSLTQEELAGHAGISARSIRSLETGRITRPRPSTVRRLADALGLADADRGQFCEAALTDLPDRAPAPRAVERERRPCRPWPALAQLPADVACFVGRAEHLRRLDTMMHPPDGAQAPVVISAVSGAAGVGKTALAVRWAHRVRRHFPDGQLYLDLRGYASDPSVAAADALTRLLTALGVPESEIPQDLDARAARFRTEVADRRLLIVLDNAGTPEQVRPLLPGTGTSVVAVTSRDRLAGLVAVDGAQRLDLDALSAAEAITLLRRLIGPRVNAEPDAAGTLAAHCAWLPLALRVAAELAVSRPDAPLADLAAELADRQRRPDLPDIGGDPRASVPAVFSGPVQHHPASVARVFRLLGLHLPTEVGADVVATLTDTDLDEARRTLDLLAQAHLIESVSAVR